MPSLPASFMESLHQAVVVVMDRDEMETLSVLLFGPPLAFRANVPEISYSDQLVAYLALLNRRGHLPEFTIRFLDKQVGNLRQEVTDLRVKFDRTFTIAEDGSIGLAPALFNVVQIGKSTPFIRRKGFQRHLRKVLGGEDFAHNVVALGGAPKSGRSYLGSYLSEIGTRNKLYKPISIDFRKDLPIGAGERPSAVHLADTLGRKISGLEEYRNMYRDRRADFKLSSFVQSLLTALQTSTELCLFFFDHIGRVPIDDSLQDLIVYLADKVARPETPGLVVVSGLLLRPGDEVFGGIHQIDLMPFDRKEVIVFFNHFYDFISTPELKANKEIKRSFLKSAMQKFPKALFEGSNSPTVAEIGELLKLTVRSILDNSEEAEDEVNDDSLILDV